MFDLSFLGEASGVRMRAAAGDTIGINAILGDVRIDLPRALAAAEAIYGRSFNPWITLNSVTTFEDGTVRRLPPTTRDRLVEAFDRSDRALMLPSRTEPSCSVGKPTFRLCP